ncbi:MAG: hypothetical protein JWN71_4733 [Xanthobacteraceae bacterium]|nr:hypothetical protein [Xanthobacteraceae bacterium]
MKGQSFMPPGCGMSFGQHGIPLAISISACSADASDWMAWISGVMAIAERAKELPIMPVMARMQSAKRKVDSKFIADCTTESRKKL